jgi:hypothetical protein
MEKVTRISFDLDDPETDLHEIINMNITKEEELDDNIMVNPFFIGIQGSELQSLSSKDIYQNYPNVFVMCMKNSVSLNNDSKLLMKIFDYTVERNEFNTICNMFTLIPTNKNILQNYNFKNKALLLDRNFLVKYFGYLNYQFEFDEIIIPMPELNESKAQIYSNLYTTYMNANKFTDIVNLISYYNNGYTQSIDRQMCLLLSNIDISNFWENSKNCNFNMNNIFNKRKLSDNITIRTGEIINNRDGNDNYIDDIKNSDTKSEYINIYQVIKKSPNRTFYVENLDMKQSFTKEMISSIFNTISNIKYKTKLFNQLLTSKELCHLVVNNQSVLSICSDILTKYKPLYAYLFGYAWATLYLEESIMTTKTTKNNSFVFDINTANKLTIFPFSMENIHNNPYITLFLDRSIIDVSTNAISIRSFFDKNNKYYGTCDLTEAKKRMNIFITGRQDIDIFKGVEKNIFSVCGSIMAAVIPKYHPLIDTCTNNDMSYIEKMTTYFNHFYGNSDTDVMCSTSSMVQFIKYTTQFIDKISDNLDCSIDDIKIDSIKKSAVIISKHFFTECLKDIEIKLGIMYTTDRLIDIIGTYSKKQNNSSNNTNYQNILHYFYMYYIKYRNNMNYKWNQIQHEHKLNINKNIAYAYKSIIPINDMKVKLTKYIPVKNDITPRDSEIYYFVNDFRDSDNKVSPDENYLVMKFSESLKFKIYAPKLKRHIELFQTGRDPFSTVARFHKPCVRAYYQDDNIYLLPSCITAMMTYINIDYKYFAGLRDPIEIINKYIMRGFSVILNFNEKKLMVKYNKNNNNHNGMFKIDSKQIPFAPKNLTDKIFKPGKYILGLSDDIYDYKDTMVYLNTIPELKEIYKKYYNCDTQKAPIDIFSFTAIGSDGTMKPLQTWVIDAWCEFINQTH